MKFEISSVLGNEYTRPCERAYKDNVYNEEDVWTINFYTARQLSEFTKQYGKIIIESNKIIIYDFYIE